MFGWWFRAEGITKKMLNKLNYGRLIIYVIRGQFTYGYFIMYWFYLASIMYTNSLMNFTCSGKFRPDIALSELNLKSFSKDIESILR